MGNIFANRMCLNHIKEPLIHISIIVHVTDY